MAKSISTVVTSLSGDDSNVKNVWAIALKTDNGRYTWIITLGSEPKNSGPLFNTEQECFDDAMKALKALKIAANA